MASTHITNRPTPQIPADADPPSDAHPYAAFTRPRSPLSNERCSAGLQACVGEPSGEALIP